MPWVDDPKFNGIIKPELEVVTLINQVTIASINDDMIKLERLKDVLEKIQAVESGSTANNQSSE